MKIRISLLILVAFIQYEGIAQSVSSVQDSIFLSITSNNQAFFEVEAQNMLTKYGTELNWTVEELAEITRAKDFWERKLVETYLNNAK